MSYYYTLPIVAEAELAEARRILGAGMPRIVGYYEEDGTRSIERIEQALAGENAAGMVLPAHTLKGESRQLGATRLGELAEVIEQTARRCVEQHASPKEVATEVAMLRACFAETLSLLKATEPPARQVLAPQHGAMPIGYHPTAAAAAAAASAAAARPAPTPPAVTPPATPPPHPSGPRTFGRRTG